VKDKDIYALFSSVAEHGVQGDDSVKAVFSTLIKTTLRYRDNMLESCDSVVTVEDVRIALEWLVPALKSGRLPETDNKTRLDLLKLWLDELKCISAI
jgi:hypothetical protein